MREIRTSGSMSGEWERSKVRLLRHRQPKGPGTDRPTLNHRTTPRLHSDATRSPRRGLDALATLWHRTVARSGRAYPSFPAPRPRLAKGRRASVFPGGPSPRPCGVAARPGRHYPSSAGASATGLARLATWSRGCPKDGVPGRSRFGGECPAGRPSRAPIESPAWERNPARQGGS